MRQYFAIVLAVHLHRRALAILGGPIVDSVLSTLVDRESKQPQPRGLIGLEDGSPTVSEADDSPPPLHRGRVRLRFARRSVGRLR